MKVKTQVIKRNLIKSLKLSQKQNQEENPNDILDTQNEPDEESDEDDVSLDSDQELQLAFARKELTPGLNVVLPAPKEFVNDKERLERKYKDLYLDLAWPERLDITVPKASCLTFAKEMGAAEPNTNGTGETLVDNDFKRESFFLKQAEECVRVGLEKLSKFGIPTKRPDDYFAEMAKSDEHMKKVRENLLSKHAEMERREKVRKLRELKKMGKTIQQEVEKKKQQAKKNLKESIKKYKKGDKEGLEIELEEEDNKLGKRKLNDEIDGHKDKKARKDSNKFQESNEKIKKKGKKAQYKDKKFGFGGRKKRSKYNTAESYAEGYKMPENKKGKFGNKKANGKMNGKKFTNKNKPKNKKSFE